jgi:hypothetical protein
MTQLPEPTPADTATRDSSSVAQAPAASRFHAWVLPAVGATLFVGTWFLLWLVERHGYTYWGLTGFVTGFGGAAGRWLGGGIGLHLFMLITCIAGTLVLAAVGLAQDMLRVSKHLWWFYAAAPLGSFTCVALWGEKIPTPECFVLLLIMHLLLSVLILPLALCALYPLWSIPGNFWHRNQPISRHWIALAANMAIALVAGAVLGAHSHGREGENLMYAITLVPLLAALAGVSLVQAVVLLITRPRGTATLLAVSLACWLVVLPAVEMISTRLSYGFWHY